MFTNCVVGSDVEEKTPLKLYGLVSRVCVIRGVVPLSCQLVEGTSGPFFTVQGVPMCLNHIL